MASKLKHTQIDSLSNTLKDKSNFILVKIDRTTHQNLESLRRELRKEKATFKVVKNTLFQKALNLTTKNRPLLNELKKKFLPLKESTALITFEEDWGKGLKVFYNFIQKEKTLSFKLGLLDKNLYSNEETERIAQLPGKDELVGKILRSFKSPVSRLAFALKFNTNKFVYILQTKSNIKN